MKYSLLLALTLGLLSCISARADSIILAADEWCPYNCSPNTTQEGYIIDIARTVFEKAGHTVDYKTMSWARAIVDARSGKITAVVGAIPEEVPDFILTKESLGVSQDHFYVLAQNTWRYKNIESLSKIQLGVINGYAYSLDILDFIKASKTSTNIHTASGEHALENNIKMTIQGRLDALVEDPNVFHITVNKMGVINKFVDAGSTAAGTTIYIAFSPKNPKSQQYADLLSAGINELRKNGGLEKILSKYGLADWVQLK